jgi:thymidylate synthase ThyX
LSRASTLILCGPEYAAHLQQSLRRATAERGFHIPRTLEDGERGFHVPEGMDDCAKRLMRKQFELYDKMQKAGVPAEDARFILPLYTRTAIETSLDARELQHLHSMSKRDGVPTEVRDTIEQMVAKASKVAPALMKDRGTNYEVLAWFPSSQLFAKSNKTLEDWAHWNNRFEGGQLRLMDYCGQGFRNKLGIKEVFMNPSEIELAVKGRDEAELANLKHYHFTFLAQMSLATFHQATRQRTWNQSVEPIYNAAIRGEFVIPVSIGFNFVNEYQELARDSINYVTANGSPEALGVLPHALKVVDLIHINGWNAVHSIGKRTCTEAQWEIRHIAKEMATRINDVCPEIGKYAVPQGIIYGKCPERKSCGLCDKALEKK